MTRINTNVSSLVAQKTLARSNMDLQKALTALSTGLRINTGKDDPAGLIASEALRSDIISVEKAITNSERASQLIATADSALAQVSALLNDIRGLVSEAANTGALSDSQIEANQLQVDSSLEAIDRIAQITSFQGRKLLDGTLDFITTGVNVNRVQDLRIDQANFGNLSAIGVSIDVVSQATRGQLNYAYSSVAENVVLEVGGQNGTEVFNFAAGSTITEIATAVNLVSDATGVRAELAEGATKGQLVVSSLGLNNDLLLTANDAGFDAGNVRVKFTDGNTSATSVSYQAANQISPATLNVALRMQAAERAAGTVDPETQTTQASAQVNSAGADNSVLFTAVHGGAAGNNIRIVYTDTATAGNETVSWNAAARTVTIGIEANGSTANQVLAAVNQNSVVNQIVTASLGAADANNNGTGAVVATDSPVFLSGAVGDQNNALTITSNFFGAAFNGTNVHFVNGDGTARGINSVNTAASNLDFGFITSVAASNIGFNFGLGANAGLDFVAQVAGPDGNDIVIEFDTADLLAVDAAAVAVNGNTITVTLNNNVGGETTAGAILDAINNHGAASLLVQVALATGSDGSTDVKGYGAGPAIELDGGETEPVANGALNFYARTGGENGNNLRIEFITDDLGGGDAAQVSVTGNVITVVLNDNGFTSANTVLNLLNNNAATSELVWVELAEGSDGTGDISGFDIGTEDPVIFTGGGGDAASRERIEYSALGRAAQTSLAFGGTNNDLIIRATSTGSAFNDVKINIVNDLTTGDAVATYDANNKVLTIRIEGGVTNANDIIAALEEVDEFEAFLDTSVEGGNTGAGTIAGGEAGANVANTANTGGDAGTLFIYMEEGVTSSQALIDRLGSAANKHAAELFSFTNAGNSDGSGRVFASTYDNALSGGANSGRVAADAQEVMNAINASGASSVLTASLAVGNDGKNVAVSSFQEFALYGSKEADNHLQFLGNKGAANVRFVAEQANQTLAFINNLGFAALNRQSTAANASLVFTATEKGGEYDGARVVFVHDDSVTAGKEVVTYDADAKVLKFLISAGATTANNIKDALAQDDYASQFFRATDFGSSNGTGLVNADLRQASASIDFAAANAAIRITANQYGTVGNDFEVAFVNGATQSVAFANNVLTITTPVATTNVNDVVELINSQLGHLFTAASTEGNGSGLVNAATQDFGGGIGVDTNGAGLPDFSASDAVTSGGLSDTLVINLATDTMGLVTTRASDIIALFNNSGNQALLSQFGISASLVGGSSGHGLVLPTNNDIQFDRTGVNFVDQRASGASIAVNGENARITVTADQFGPQSDGIRVVFVADPTVTQGNEVASYNAQTKILQVTIDAGNSTANNVIAAINAQLDGLFTADTSDDGDGSGVVTASDTLVLSGGQIENGSDTGAKFLGNANQGTTGITFVTAQFGSNAFVSINALSGSFDVTDKNHAVVSRSIGTDVNARINGIQAVGKGLQASINTAALDLTFTLSSGIGNGEKVDFSIVGGGAQFQLGPAVVSNQQARMGIQAINTARLGGVSGKLFQIRSGGSQSLFNDPSGAAAIVEEAISQVTQLRGRLGAFQRTTLETNIFTLNDTLANLTDTESSIRDADFAFESARLTRAQILVQSGTSVLAIANSNPQNVLALLR